MKLSNSTLPTILVALSMTLGFDTCRSDDAPTTPVGTGNSFNGPLGLQLWSLRDEFKKGVPATLAKVADFGFRTVELAGTYGKSPEEFNALLASNHLKAVAGHFGYDRFRDDPEGVAREASALDLEWAGTAWVPHEGQVTEDWVRETATVFNRAGKVLARHGLKFYYHNHGYEFVPHLDGTLFDLLVRETEPGVVFFEMDVMWTVFPGQDPTELMKRHAGRWALMHIKDLKQGVPTGSLSGGTDPRNGVVIGQGQTDWPALLRAAKAAGVKHYFIEDEAPNVLEQIPQSLKFLEQIQF